MNITGEIAVAALWDAVFDALDRHPDPDDGQIRDYLSGNLCRCAAYPEIVDAVKMAARKSKARSTG